MPEPRPHGPMLKSHVLISVLAVMQEYVYFLISALLASLGLRWSLGFQRCRGRSCHHRPSDPHRNHEDGKYEEKYR